MLQRGDIWKALEGPLLTMGPSSIRFVFPCSYCAMLLSVFFLLVFADTQLDRSQESDRGRVFEINLNGQALEQVPDLKEVGL